MWAFGEPVVLFPERPGADPAGYAVRGIFDTPPEQAGMGLTVALSNQAPWIGFRVLELPDAELPEQGMQFEARGARWEVVDVQPDGGGHVRCQVFRVGPGATAPLPPVSDPAPIPTPPEVTAPAEPPVDVEDFLAAYDAAHGKPQW